jgi:hypothetical protein
MGPSMGPMAGLRPRANIQKSPGFRDSNSTGDIGVFSIVGVWAVQLHLNFGVSTASLAKEKKGNKDQRN